MCSVYTTAAPGFSSWEPWPGERYKVQSASGRRRKLKRISKVHHMRHETTDMGATSRATKPPSITAPGMQMTDAACGVTDALSVDVEDYFHVEAFADRVSRD